MSNDEALLAGDFFSFRADLFGRLLSSFADFCNGQMHVAQPMWGKLPACATYWPKLALTSLYLYSCPCCGVQHVVDPYTLSKKTRFLVRLMFLLCYRWQLGGRSQCSLFSNIRPTCTGLPTSRPDRSWIPSRTKRFFVDKPKTSNILT